MASNGPAWTGGHYTARTGGAGVARVRSVAVLLYAGALMKCRNCGTDIADKALICYRCGTATTEAKSQPYVAPKGRAGATLIYIVIAVAVLALLAWFLLHSTN